MGTEFAGYFDATEEAFAQEKEEMLYKIEGLEKIWSDNVKMDDEARAKCLELQTLKNVLAKQHLQLLRTREEALQMRLKNATLGFQVRQLQAEIFRLLPFSRDHVPSTEYHMSLDQNLYREKAASLRIEADPEHAADLARLRDAWQALTQTQSQVFEEELQKAKEDGEQWQQFERDFNSQNHDAHRLIDKQLGEITRKLVYLRAQFEEMQVSKRDALNSIKRKLDRLRQRDRALLPKMTEKSSEERGKARLDASKQCNLVRGRVREIERKNLLRFSAMKELDNELQGRELALLRETDALAEKIDVLTRKNDGLAAEGNGKISKLEEQLNAVFSAAAAIQDGNLAEEERLLGAVAGAVGHHGAAVAGVEQLNLEIQHMAEHIGQVTARFKMI
jgi:hypothetical protein